MKGKKKNPTKLGKWLDQNGIEQQELEDATGVSRNTISRLCNNKSHNPSHIQASFLKSICSSWYFFFRSSGSNPSKADPFLLR